LDQEGFLKKDKASG